MQDGSQHQGEYKPRHSGLNGPPGKAYGFFWFDSENSTAHEAQVTQHMRTLYKS